MDLFITVDLLVTDKKKSENEGKESEDAVQERIFHYFPRPQTKDLDIFM